MADPGFSRRGGHQPQIGRANLLVWPFFPESCIKLKNNLTSRGWYVVSTPLGSANANQISFRKPQLRNSRTLFILCDGLGQDDLNHRLRQLGGQTEHRGWKKQTQWLNKITNNPFVQLSDFRMSTVATRMHSNGLRTTYLLTVSQHALSRGWGWGCLPGGSAQGGVFPGVSQHAMGQTSFPLWTDRHL